MATQRDPPPVSIRSNKVDQALGLTSRLVNEHRPSTREVVDITRDFPFLHAVAGLRIENCRERDPAQESDVPVMIHTANTFNPKFKVRFSHPLEHGRCRSG